MRNINRSPIDSYQDSSLRRNVKMVDLKFVFDHFQNAIFQGCTTKMVFDVDEVVVGTFDVVYVV